MTCWNSSSPSGQKKACTHAPIHACQLKGVICSAVQCMGVYGHGRGCGCKAWASKKPTIHLNCLVVLLLLCVVTTNENSCRFEGLSSHCCSSSIVLVCLSFVLIWVLICLDMCKACSWMQCEQQLSYVCVTLKGSIYMLKHKKHNFVIHWMKNWLLYPFQIIYTSSCTW